jgi:two-component system, NarL family, nitrate/nitrite response regulator NarL
MIRLRVAVVDDHPLMLEGVKGVIADSSEFEIVGSASNLHEAVAVAQNYAPDVMLLDINIPGNGFETMKAVNKIHPGIKIIFFTVSERLDHVKMALELGAMGYVIKGASVEDIHNCLRSVRNGKRFITPLLAARVLGGDSDYPTLADGHEVRFSDKEVAVVKLLAAGLTNREIADKLNLSEKTVKHHMSVIMEKLRVRNRVEAALAISRMPEMMQ